MITASVRLGVCDARGACVRRLLPLALTGSTSASEARPPRPVPCLSARPLRHFAPFPQRDVPSRQRRAGHTWRRPRAGHVEPCPVTRRPVSGAVTSRTMLWRPARSRETGRPQSLTAARARWDGVGTAPVKWPITVAVAVARKWQRHRMRGREVPL